MTSRDRFQAAVRNQPVDRPPVWVMRQAGRYLPEYRKLKECYSFLQLAQTPELAVEVTLQPLKRFALDAAILFSDILVVPEAMGQPYHFKEQGGIAMDFTLESTADIDKLSPNRIHEHLDYVAQALRILRKELPDTALLGFGGSPWTLACYMIDGNGGSDFPKTRELYYNDPASFMRLMEKLTEAIINYFSMQAAEGVEAIQIFDSWAGIAPSGKDGQTYREVSLQWIEQIIEAVGNTVPIIVFPKGRQLKRTDFQQARPAAVGIDWAQDIVQAHDALGDIGVQGNLDPVLMQTTPAIVRRETRKLLASMYGRTGHILNLGHGIRPQAKLECVAALVETVAASAP